jgi:signal-transduction protein with cAMP-binding, CBS, and nucleotidyltransferase domain
MALVGEVGAYPAFTVGLDAPVITAARTMRDKEIGAVIAVDESDVLAGILTDRDLTLRVAAAGLDFATVPVVEVCTLAPWSVNATDDTDVALQLMQEYLVHRLPIVDHEQRPMGMLSLEDLAASPYIDDRQLRQVHRVIAREYQLRSAAVP